ADSITIIVKDAGRTLIQVVDNGCGMAAADARMAFERHATSKISNASDLFSLHTMGFRGEALPSIAAVAQVELRTMRKDDTVGTRICVSESKFEGSEPCPCIPGTNLSVRNIFFHMPARRKFLKKDSVELGHIIREFERLALVNTHVAFTLIHNDVTLHQFLPGTLKQRIGSLFGKHLESLLAPVATETSLVRISGLVGMPRSAKRRGYQQFLFVNGRNMRHPAFHKAILKCYEQLIPADTQPSYFISFDVDPATIDVNIHPQKHEIKFENEQAIWQILTAAVRETLGKTQALGALDFDSEDAPDIPLFSPEDNLGTPGENFDEAFNPFDTPVAPAAASFSRATAPRNTVPHDWEKLYDSFNKERENAFSEEVLLPANLGDEASEVPAGLFDETAAPATDVQRGACFQLGDRYIISPSDSGIMVVSQHRAHIRILYDRFMRQLTEGNVTSQQLLFAEDLDLSPAAAAAMPDL
ncbi:MAG: DNA mismatch repair endonuclease MutL, partial [Muribaculaceae bacterium]|nr:DNA mismatch repair endonuclease MutL [Muribaculaceae bacterium]